MFSLFQMTPTNGGQASSPFSSWKAPPLVTSQPDFITSHHFLVNEADSLQAAPFPERAVEGGPGLRVGAQSGGEVGISAAQGEEAVPSRGPPGLRGAVIVEASTCRAGAAAGGCPRGPRLASEESGTAGREGRLSAGLL